MPYYKNVCSLLASINSGIVHQRPSVKLPLTKVGLELSQVLTNLGILSGYSVGQRLSRLAGHSRVWDPAAAAAAAAAGPGPAPASAYAGFPALYLNLQLNWAKHQPLSAGALAAAAAHRPGGAAASFSPPAPLHGPTPESVKIISKPSHQRWMSLAQLLAARAAAPPGVFLLSTHQGVLTDIDAELRGLGGILLGRLALPLGHVLQLRGLLRAKHQQELAAAAAAAAAAPEAPAGQQAAPVHAPLREWDARAAAGQLVSDRLERLSRLAAAEGEAYMRGVVLGPDDAARQQRSTAADDKATLLRLQELVWRRRQAGEHQQQQQSAGGGGSRARRGSGRGSRG